MKNPENKTGFLVGGGVLAALLASLCCIGPLVLTLIGVGGAATLAKLDILRAPLILVVFGVFAVSGILLYRKKENCEPGSICAIPKSYRRMKMLYWIGFLISMLLITSPYWVGVLFD